MSKAQKRLGSTDAIVIIGKARLALSCYKGGYAPVCRRDGKHANISKCLCAQELPYLLYGAFCLDLNDLSMIKIFPDSGFPGWFLIKELEIREPGSKINFINGFLRCDICRGIYCMDGGDATNVDECFESNINVITDVINAKYNNRKANNVFTVVSGMSFTAFFNWFKLMVQQYTQNYDNANIKGLKQVCKNFWDAIDSVVDENYPVTGAQGLGQDRLRGDQFTERLKEAKVEKLKQVGDILNEYKAVFQKCINSGINQINIDQQLFAEIKNLTDISFPGK